MSYSNAYKNNFKRNQDDHLEKQVKQIIYENFDDINEQTIKKSKEEIEKKYLPQFKKELSQEKGIIGQEDLKTLFTTISGIYKKAGLNKDADIFENYSITKS